jgi:hypothetical protein
MMNNRKILDTTRDQISIGPDVPVSDRVRLPWRWSAAIALVSPPDIGLGP